MVRTNTGTHPKLVSWIHRLFRSVRKHHSVCCLGRLLKRSVDYAYPEFSGIDVTKPATSADQREKAREAVQKYYGLDPDNTETTLTAARLGIFQPPALEGHKSFNYRVFIVAVQLPEHAFNMPYTFRLHYQKSEYEEELIGSVAVFARPDYSPCKGCASRRDNRNMVRGVITIPPTLVDHIIRTSGQLNKENVLESELVAGIKKLLKGRLLDSAGLELGVHAKEPLTHGPLKHKETLPSHLAPGEIELRSSAIARPLGGGPAHFYDWKYHEEVFQVRVLITVGRASSLTCSLRICSTDGEREEVFP